MRACSVQTGQRSAVFRHISTKERRCVTYNHYAIRAAEKRILILSCGKKIAALGQWLIAMKAYAPDITATDSELLIEPVGELQKDLLHFLEKAQKNGRKVYVQRI